MAPTFKKYSNAICISTTYELDGIMQKRSSTFNWLLEELNIKSYIDIL